ncbi:hypothetical protein EV126DRAFT_409733 [Verticillium dahliae]|nr:hypothetical protein EV126DRAFT_409733 [Verticillium dahliae]
MQVFCITDGINLYENELFLDGMDTVILSLVGLVMTSKSDGQPALRLLITSPQPTLGVQKVFRDDPDALLDLYTLPAP